MGNRGNAAKKLVSYFISICMMLSSILYIVPVVQAEGTSVNKVYTLGGRYYEGNTVRTFVYFNEPVTVTGQPYLETTVGSVYYKSGDGTNTLEFDGVIPQIQNPVPLNYFASDSFKLDVNSSIKSVATGLDMDLTLPDPFSENALCSSNAFVQDGPSNNTNLTGRIAVPADTVLNNVYFDLNIASVDDSQKRYFEYGSYLGTNKDFHLGNFEPNKQYVISARCMNSYNEVIMQGETMISTDALGNPTTNDVTINLNNPQLNCIVKMPNGDLYNNTRFPNIRVEKTDGTWMSSYPEIAPAGLGKYQIYYLQDGEYYLWAEPMSKDYGASLKTVVKIQNGVLLDAAGSPAASNTIDLQLRTPQIAGTVTAPDGTALQGQCDIAISGGSTPKMKGMLTNELGEYNFTGLADGDYTIRAIPRGISIYAASKPYKVTISQGELAAVNGNTVSGNVYDIPLSVPSLTGTIETPAGETFSGINYNVDISSTDEFGKGNYEYSVMLQDNKTFHLGSFEPNKTYMISARCFSGNQAIMCGETKINTDAAGFPTPNNVVINLLKPQIEFAVNTPNGDPYIGDYPNIRVERTDGVKDNYPRIEPTGIGKYDVYQLPDGEYNIWAEPMGKNYGASAKIMVRIQNGVLVDSTGNPSSFNTIILNLRNPQVIGTITAPDGSVLQEQCDISISGSVDKLEGVRTNDIGEYNITGLSDGDYTIRAMPNSASKYAASKIYNITISNGALAAVNGTSVSENENVCNISLGNPSILGTIVSPDGEDLSSAEYSVNVNSIDSNGKYNYEYGFWLGTSKEFRLGNLEPNKTYIINARCTKDGQDIMMGETQITTGPNGNPSINNVVVNLKKPQIKFTLYTPNGDVYTGNFPDIRVERTDGTFQDNKYRIEQRANGNYEVYGLPDGEYAVWVQPMGKDYGSSNKIVIKIQNGELVDTTGAPAATNTFDLKLRTPQISGTVTAPDGTALQERSDLYIYNSAAENIKGAGTNEIGEYNISDLADGDYTIMAVPFGGSSYSVSKLYKMTIANSKLAAVNDTTVTQNVYDIPLSTPSLTGTIVSSTGETLADVNYNLDVLTVDDFGKPNFQYGVWLESNKDFRLGNLEPNKTYIINARCSSYTNGRFMQGQIKITTDKYGNPTTNNLTIAVKDFIIGDVNGDGVVTKEDAALVLQYATDLVQLNQEQYGLADVNGDGMVTAADATLILRYL